MSVHCLHPKPQMLLLNFARTTDITTGVRHSTPRPASHCRVLPPGQLNGTITAALLIYFESFKAIVQLFSHNHANEVTNGDRWHKQPQVTKNMTLPAVAEWHNGDIINVNSQNKTCTTNQDVNLFVLLLRNRLKSSAICSSVFRFATITIM